MYKFNDFVDCQIEDFIETNYSSLSSQIDFLIGYGYLNALYDIRNFEMEVKDVSKS